VLGLALEVFLGFGFLAAEAFFSAFEVVVLTLAAFPASVGELEVLHLFFPALASLAALVQFEGSSLGCLGEGILSHEGWS
jgi:hypothetical protein